MPEGASWQDVFDASEGSTEWEAKTYEMGPHDLSFEVTLSEAFGLDLGGQMEPKSLQKFDRFFD